MQNGDIRIAFVGPSACGKTQLLCEFCRDDSGFCLENGTMATHGILYAPSVYVDELKILCIELGGSKLLTLKSDSRIIPRQLTWIVLVFNHSEPSTFDALFTTWWPLVFELFAANESSQPRVMILGTTRDATTCTTDLYGDWLAKNLPPHSHLYWRVNLTVDTATFWTHFIQLIKDQKSAPFCLNANDKVKNGTPTTEKIAQRCRRPCVIL